MYGEMRLNVILKCNRLAADKGITVKELDKGQKVLF